MNTTIIIITIVALLLVFFIVGMFNNLIRKRNEVDNAFGGLDSQLKKRYDLIPNLVEVVKQYAAHEKELLTRITEMRTKAIESNMDQEEKVALDNQISKGMNSIMLAVENYPALKANENFLNLQRALNETEEQISAARRTYNAVVTSYNNSIMIFPQNIVAGMLRMTPKKVFEIPEAERENIDIKKIF